MSLPIDHTFFWPPRKYAADQRWDEDHRMGVGGDRPPYLHPGTYYVYFSRSDSGPSGGVYNLTSEQADEVVKRLERNRVMTFEELLEGMPGVGFAYRNEEISYID